MQIFAKSALDKDLMRIGGEGFKEAWKECNPIAIYKAMRSI